MLNVLLNSKTKGIASATAVVAFFSLLSSFLGLFRDRLLAGTFGASDISDVYFAAFRVPDFVYGILVAGGITAAFIPLFSERFKEGKEQAMIFASNILNCFLFLLSLLCLVLAVLSPFLIDFIAPGFSDQNKELTVQLTQIMFLSPILLGVSAIFSGVLQYFDRFLLYSLAPVMYNLGIIFGILFLVPIFSVYGLAFGVILGALLHLLIQVPGVLASVSLGIYMLLILALFKLIPVTLTLAGIGGFILSVGMAVDANVLIFSRMREELRSGKTFSQSLEDGFTRAWTSIRDGNLTTLIVAIILFGFGTSFIKGFAFTLSLGILVSMFSAIIISKNFLRLFVGTKLEKFKWLWQ